IRDLIGLENLVQLDKDGIHRRAQTKEALRRAQGYIDLAVSLSRPIQPGNRERVCCASTCSKANPFPDGDLEFFGELDSKYYLLTAQTEVVSGHEMFRYWSHLVLQCGFDPDHHHPDRMPPFGGKPLL